MIPTAFISSTSLDLAEYRKAAIDACNELSIVPMAMEFFGAAGVGRQHERILLTEDTENILRYMGRVRSAVTCSRRHLWRT